MTIDPIQLSLFSHQINALCEEMGAQLQRAAFSPNIRDRLDYSCAMFDRNGQLCAQAAHIPVHLGSMAFAMQSIVQAFEWQTGDLVIFNDPFLGGTHLPDITLVTPVFVQQELIGFVANRAHHADVGADEPGSMPLSSHLQQEGIVLSPQLLGQDFKIDEGVFERLFQSLPQQQTLYADLCAQVGANIHGEQRLCALAADFANASFSDLVEHLFEYAEKLARIKLSRLKNGVYTHQDVMDDDGLGNVDIPIRVQLLINDGSVQVDFGGSAGQVDGNINCPKAVTAAAVYYVFRCLIGDDVPACQGSFAPISIVSQPGSLVDAQFPAAVAAGNVETSSRIVDVLFAALADACPDQIPACSQGTMNNLAMGSVADAWSYYETIGGGAGAGAMQHGMAAVQTHMTNTQNTPIEVLEMNYPVRVTRYQIRLNSGGHGSYKGGDGIVREFEFLRASRVTIISERRRHGPAGLGGGAAGKPGANFLNNEPIAGKVALSVVAGDRVRIETPGGGGFGYQ